MDPVTLAHVAHVTGGRLVRATNADELVGPDVVTDSRVVTPGDCSWPSRGNAPTGMTIWNRCAIGGLVPRW